MSRQRQTACSVVNRSKRSHSLGRCNEQFHAKEACFERGEEKNSDQPSVSDFCHLCVCLKQSVEMSHLKALLENLSEEQQPSMSAQNIFFKSLVKGKGLF